MILWLNGPYGIGKSTLAEALNRRLTNTFIFDAEQLGNAIRDNMPESFYHETFEEVPLWREICVRMLGEISRNDPGHVLVPMTLMQPMSIDIFERLKDAGADVRHVMLYADEAVVHRRICERGEDEDCWCARQTRRCLDSQRDMPVDLLLNAHDSPENLADEIIDAFQL